MDSNYTYINNLLETVEVPKDGILSKILLKDDYVNVTMFGFDAGQELSEHTAATPAIIQIMRGEADLTVSGEAMSGGPGTWIYMPARAPHSLIARTPVVMLLVLVKSHTKS